MPTSFSLRLAIIGIVIFPSGCGGKSNAKMIAQLSDSDPKVRCVAARALGEQQGNAGEAVVALANSTKDGDLAVREAAVVALKKLGPAAKSSEPALEQALRDPELSVRLGAAMALAKVNPASQSYKAVILDSLNAGHGTVFLDVGKMGADANWTVPTLVKLLSHSQAGIRALAARTLGDIGAVDDDGEAALRRRLRDDDPVVRKAAERALAKTGR